MAQDYTNMSVQDKLKLADERLEKLKGTDKYDAFKERVDAMHAKYEPEITKLGQNLEKAGYSRDIANDATWDYKNNRMGLGPVAGDRIRHEADVIGRSKVTGFISGVPAFVGSHIAGSMDAFKTSNAVRSATIDTAKGILQGARDTLAATVRKAGQKAVAEATQAAGGKIAGLTASAAGNLAKGNAAAEAITHFGLTGEQAAENAKVATDAFKAAKTAQTELSAVKVGINTAGHNARVAAWNAGQKGLQTAAEQASQVAGGAGKAGRMAGLTSGAKTFLKGNAASSFAIGGATSAIKGAIDLGGTIKATGGEGFGTAVKDTFTTKRGWKNLGLGFVGALRDVGNSMTFGAIENGDRTREKMMAAKGGEAPDLTGMSNFLATDKVPDTIFGIPVVSRREDYTEADIAFFKEHPEAGGYYDMGDEETEPESQGAVGGGRGKRVVGYPESEYEYTREKNPTRIDPNDIKGTGVSFTDADRVRVPEERLGEYGKWLDRIAALDPTMKEQRLVPPDWRTNPGWKEFQRDYDYGAAFMAGVEVPTTKAPDGRYHLSDAGKLPTHPTFSKESYYARDPRWSGLAGEWTQEGNYVPGELESRHRSLQAQPGDIRELWNRAVKSTGNLDGMARMFAAMAGESSLSQRGATAEQISNGHLARLIVHANETDRYNKNPANYRKRTVLDTTNSTSHVLSKYKWGTGPGANWFDSSKMEPRFDLINSDPVAAKTARSLIMNAARFLNGDLKGKDWLPSDAISYGDGPKGLMPDREEIKPEENRIGPMPRGFRIGRKKGAK